MRIVFIGTLESSHRLLARIAACADAELVGVVTRAAAQGNADFHTLGPQATTLGCPCLLVDQASDTDMATWIAACRPDVIYCFGWSWLLKDTVLNAAPLGVVGYHPTLLPMNRGRHPIIWALALGLELTGSTFFRMDAGADSGDILSQVEVPIGAEDDAASLYARLMDVAERQVVKMTAGLAAGTLVPHPQDHSCANVWRKRGKSDGQIDWRMPAEGIHNLIRALTRPYVGAHFRWRDNDVKVWRSVIGPAAPENIEPGRVLAASSGQLQVKCGNGSVILIEYEAIEPPAIGEYLN